MKSWNIQFKTILSQYNSLREINFINKLVFLAKEDKKKFVFSIAKIFKEDLNVHLKYLLIRTLNTLKYSEFFPVLVSSLKQETKIQIIKELIKSIQKYNSLDSYIELHNQFLSSSDENIKILLLESLKQLKSNNKEIFYFDILYNEYSDIKMKDLQNACNYLTKNLKKSFLPILLSKFPVLGKNNLKYILLIFKNRTDNSLCSGLLRFYFDNYNSSDEIFFSLMTETLINNLYKSPLKNKSFSSLIKITDEVSSVKKKILLLNLLKIKQDNIFPKIKDHYSNFNPLEKEIFLKNLQDFHDSDYLTYFQNLFLVEYTKKLLTNIIIILLNYNDLQFIMEKLDSFSPSKRDQVLSILTSISTEGLSKFLIKYFTPDYPDNTLEIILQYFLSHNPDKYFTKFQSLINSGISTSLKIQIIRKLDKFNSIYQKEILSIFFSRKRQNHTELIKNLLISVQRAFSDKNLISIQFREWLLNKILIQMEKAQKNDIVNFIYFFDNYQFLNRKEARLVIEELKLIQNTFLKTRQSHDFIRMIQILIKNITKKNSLPLV